MSALPNSILKIEKDNLHTMASGASFTAPAGWILTTTPDATILEAPDGDIRLAIAVSSAPTAEGAVSRAWPVLFPDFRRAVKMCQAVPAREGWDEAMNYGYECSPDERLCISSMALRKGKVWTALLFWGSESAFERRRAQVRLIASGFRPAGYHRESFRGKTAAALDSSKIKQLTEFLENAIAVGGIPGIAMSLVQNGAVIFEGGFGVRRLGDPAPVNADTLFLIASNTKQLTTLLLAKLVDEGKFRWDTPVTEVFPTFRLGDEDATRRMQIKHLLSASTGFPRKDLEWLLNFQSSTSQKVFDLLATMKPTSRFGELFQYSNILGAAAGYVAGHALYPDRELGLAYDEAMRTRVFSRLRMSATTFDYARALAGNHAWPHSEDVDGTPRCAAMDINYAAIPIRPALGVWTNARDLARYVRMELARGRLPEGESYIAEEPLLARRTPGVVFEEDGAYGLGLVIKTKYGIPVVDHGGALIGFKSNIFWLPDHDVGGVLLTNADNGNLLVQSFVRKFLEVLFDGRPEADEDVATAAQLRKEQILKHRERLSVPANEDAVSQLAAHYRSDVLGEITVRTGGRNAVFDFGEWKSEIASRRNEDGTLSFFTIDPGVGSFEFVAGERANKRVLVVRDKQHEYAFEAD